MPGLEYFHNVLLCGSSQDFYVPIHSAHIELCNAAVSDTSDNGMWQLAVFVICHKGHRLIDFFSVISCRCCVQRDG